MGRSCAFGRGLGLRRGLLALAVPALCLWTLGGCESARPLLATTAEVEAPVGDDRLAWWREARFGLFVHWGLYSIPAGEWDGVTTHGEWIRTTARIPLERYEELRAQWQPRRFDADAWAKAARDAGMQYMVVTTKHHDGFALFDSHETDWDVGSTPEPRDVMKDIAAANARAGLVTGWYYSIMDWHHPDYVPRRDWEHRSTDGADFERYERFLQAQVTELLTNYGPVGVMWFDGEWEQNWNHERGRRLYELCRKLQPNVIVNNRVDVGRSGMAGLSVKGDFVGDFGTPEQEVPPTGLPGVDWESCMTMNGGWGYNAHDKDFKSTRQLVRTLVDIASKGGNFLLNIGPTADGEFPPECLERLRGIGAWMRVNGQAIHGTVASPLTAPAWGRVTMADRGGDVHLYLMVFDWPSNGRLVLDGLGNAVRDAHLWAATPTTLATERTDRAIVVRVPERAPDADVSVIDLTIAGRPIVYAAPTIEASTDAFVHSLVARVESHSRDLDVHYTLDGSEPTLASPRAPAELTLTESTVVRARGFHGSTGVTDVVDRRLTRAVPAPAGEPRNLVPGLACSRTSMSADSTSDVVRPTARTAESVDIVQAVAVPAADRKREKVRLVFDGWMRVPRDDVYSFALASDDGSTLRLDGRVVCDNGGDHTRLEKRGSAALAAGWHRIEVEWSNNTGGSDLQLLVAAPGQPWKPLSPDDLAHEGADVRGGATGN